MFPQSGKVKIHQAVTDKSSTPSGRNTTFTEVYGLHSCKSVFLVQGALLTHES